MTAAAARDRLTLDNAAHQIVRLDRLAGSARLPFSLKVLPENLQRNEYGRRSRRPDPGIETLADWDPAAQPSAEIRFSSAQVLLQDLAGADRRA